MIPSFVFLAAGMSRRFGRLKQLEPVGPSGEALMDYTVFDAFGAGFRRFVFVVRPEIRDAIGAHLAELFGDAPGGGVEWVLVDQRGDDLPVGHAIRPRPRPWGTGQAVWAARDVVDGPFVVANADDFYGRGALELAWGAAASAHRDGDWALVSYRLDRTLASGGGVSRGVCSLGPGSEMVGIREVLDIERGEEGRITGIDGRGVAVGLSPDDPVSLNLWAFGTGIFTELETGFRRFLETLDRAESADGPSPDGSSTDGSRVEFLLPRVVGDAVDAGIARVNVLPAPDRWMGITHPGDRDAVVRGLRALHDGGEYPPALAEALQGRSSRGSVAPAPHP